MSTEEQILTTTNHVSEGLLHLCTRQELANAVTYWSLRCSDLAAEVAAGKKAEAMSVQLDRLAVLLNLSEQKLSERKESK